MDRPVRSFDGLPLPRFRTLALLAVLATVAWLVWSAPEAQTKTRQALWDLWDQTAPNVRRIKAVEEWVKLGRAAVPELTSALESPDAKTRELAAMGLARIGPDARPAGPELADLLGDPSEQVRSMALRALPRVEYLPEEILPGIAALLSAKDAPLRDDAVELLGGIGTPAIPVLCSVVEAPERDARKYAVALLGRLGKENQEAAAAIHRAATDTDGEIRSLAYRILIFWNELTLEEAIAGLQDANPRIACEVAATVDRLEVDSAVLVPRLLGLFDNDGTRHAALQGLWALGPRAKSAAPDVAALLQSESLLNYHTYNGHGGWTDPELVLDVLARIAKGEESLAPQVEPFLFERSEYGNWCRAAGEALKEVSPVAARAAVPQLVEKLSRGDPREKVRAAAALCGLGTLAKEATSALIEALSDSDDWVRLYCMRALTQIGSASAIPRLAALANEQPEKPPPGNTRADFGGGDTQARAEAVEALARIGVGREDAIEAILRATRHPEPYVRRAAAAALVSSGCAPELAVPRLTEMLGEKDVSVRMNATLALGSFKSAPKLAVPVLESALLDPDLMVQKSAAIALAEFGPAARSAVPLLTRLAQTPGRSGVTSEEFPIVSAWSEQQSRGLGQYAVPYFDLTRDVAIRALQKIDPAAMERAEKGAQTATFR